MPGVPTNEIIKANTDNTSGKLFQVQKPHHRYVHHYIIYDCRTDGFEIKNHLIEIGSKIEQLDTIGEIAKTLALFAAWDRHAGGSGGIRIENVAVSDNWGDDERNKKRHRYVVKAIDVVMFDLELAWSMKFTVLFNLPGAVHGCRIPVLLSAVRAFPEFYLVSFGLI